MKTLVLQLARFGDLYTSWPALRAWRRCHPDGELHLLVRASFREALEGLDAGVIVHELPVAPAVAAAQADDVDGALTAVAGFLARMRAHDFDEVVNLTFSPLSSRLTEAIAGGKSRVRGYSRHADGSLAIPDDASAYFYAQVGPGRSNRFHLSEIFAAVLDVELQDRDYRAWPSSLRENVIVIHTGASQAQKRYPVVRWSEVVNGLCSAYSGKIALIGGPGDREISRELQAGRSAVLNFAGELSLAETVDLIARSRLLIGGDSAPIHMAALTDTPVLNLSCAAVNFWETGPVSPGSRVLFTTDIANLDPVRVTDEALSMVSLKGPVSPGFVRVDRREPFSPHAIADDDFGWRLVQALYTGTPFPELSARVDRLAFRRVHEIALLALDQLRNWEPTGNAAKILGMVDEMLGQIGRMNASVKPVLEWFDTQRLRLPPAPVDETLRETRRLFEELHTISLVYVEARDASGVIEAARDLCRRILPDLRECQLNRVRPQIQDLMLAAQDIARISTTGDGPSWSSVLAELDQALVREDPIAVADSVEFRFFPALDQCRAITEARQT